MKHQMSFSLNLASLLQLQSEKLNDKTNKKQISTLTTGFALLWQCCQSNTDSSLVKMQRTVILLLR